MLSGTLYSEVGFYTENNSKVIYSYVSCVDILVSEIPVNMQQQPLTHM